MTSTRRTFLAAAVLGTLSVRSLFAEEKEKKAGEWDKLGEKTVSKKEERDVIDVTGPTRYTTLNFKVEKGNIEIEDIKVTFDDDKVFSPETKLVFKEGQESGKIDLPGASRAIKHVRFLYRSLGKGEAVIALYGKIGETPKR